MRKRRFDNKYTYMAIMTFAVFFLCVLIFYYSFLFPFQSFYLNASPAFKVVDRFTNFVPQGIDYVEISNTTLVKNDNSMYEFLQDVHEIMPAIKAEKPMFFQIKRQKSAI